MLAAVYEADADTTSSRQIMMRFCLEAEMRGKEGESGRPSIVVTASTNPRLKAAIGSVDVEVVFVVGGSVVVAAISAVLLGNGYYLRYNRGEEF